MLYEPGRAAPPTIRPLPHAICMTLRSPCSPPPSARPRWRLPLPRGRACRAADARAARRVAAAFAARPRRRPSTAAGELVVRYGGGAHASRRGRGAAHARSSRCATWRGRRAPAAQAARRAERHAATTSRTSRAGCRRTRATRTDARRLADAAVELPGRDGRQRAGRVGAPRAGRAPGRQGRHRRGAGHRRRLRRPRPLPQVAGPQRRSASSAAGTSSTTTRTRTTTSATAPTSRARSPRAPATRSASPASPTA